jgi:NADPH-dependent glutamate synthase beta subunit-like oxidoreductase
MFEAIAIMGGLGVVVGAGLAAASKIFYVYVDPIIVAIDEELPGANCGGCGYPGCTANAEAIAAGKSPPNSCVAAGIETAEAIAAVLGVAIEAKEPDIAKSGCYFGYQDADTRYLYDGLSDCRAASLLGGGMKICEIGCLGLGSCAAVCPFDAIVMGPDNLPVVDAEKCTGCGTCERVCPKHIITLSSVTRRILREYTDDECTTPCQRACPAGIDIREYIHQIAVGDYHRSVQVIKERNPFPTVIGRICPRPCENDCRRQMVDDPVAINFLKRFAADYERDGGTRIQPYKAPPSGRKIAVVGGGVEGLSAGFFSARLGHGVTLFEASDKLGGMLWTAIAPERLPADVLEWDIEGVLDMGVEAETGKALGKDFTIPALLEGGYDAVFTGTGGWDSRLTRIPSSEIESQFPGTYLLIDLIKADTGRSNRIAPAGPVAILGGGRAAIKGAEICRDLGAETVTVLLREQKEQLSKEALAMVAEVEDDSVITLRFGAGVGAISGYGGELTEIEAVDLRSGERDRLTVRSLFLGAGRFPEMIFTRRPTAEAGPVAWRGVPPYKNPYHKDEEGLFSPGDALTDFSAAIRAIGAGRRAAASMHRLLYDIPLELDEDVLTPDSRIQDVDSVRNVNPTARQIMPVANPRELAETGELEKGFSESQAIQEAGRCLQCGLICYERSVNVQIGLVGEPEPAAEETAA